MHRFFDSSGNYIGMRDRDGRYYDLNGDYLGFIDSKGRFFDRNGQLMTAEQEEDPEIIIGRQSPLAPIGMAALVSAFCCL